MRTKFCVFRGRHDRQRTAVIRIAAITLASDSAPRDFAHLSNEPTPPLGLYLLDLDGCIASALPCNRLQINDYMRGDVDMVRECSSDPCPQ